MICDSLLDEVTNFYLKSEDYNGISVASLVARHGEAKVRTCLSRLIDEGLVSVVFGDYHPNPHIRALPSEPTIEQRQKLDTQLFQQACVYPNTKHLTQLIDRTAFTDRPFELCLALGEPQLTYKSFDLSVLETYRNDPRYYYSYDDIRGLISAKNEFFETGRMRTADQVLLESFGFSFDQDKNIYVAAFLRYLSSLSPEHQLVWASKQVSAKTQLHPDYFRASIMGRWPDRLSLYQAVLLEMKTANEICAAIGREPIFRDDFAESRRPREFGYLLRPTLKEYNEFVHLLDKMLSENINLKFFSNDVPLASEEQRSDGKMVVRPKGTIQLLSDWLRAKFKTDDWSEIEKMLQTLREIRSARHKPAHSIGEDKFDQRYVREQLELMKRVYSAVKILRVVLALHPAASGITVCRELEEGLVWSV